MASNERGKYESERAREIYEVYARVARDIERIRAYMQEHGMWWGSDLCNHLLNAYRIALTENALYAADQEQERSKAHDEPR